MPRWLFFLPLAGLVTFAAYLGLRAGNVPTETEIINRYATAYVAAVGNGAKPTDCAATIHPNPEIRMVIACAHASGLMTTYFVGPHGEALPQPQGPSA